jgi:3-methylcrotonyl-CoA carboxylase beta subunit
VPLVFLQNITGFMIGEEYERKGITKNGAQMVMTQATVDVPKFTIMCNGSYGAGNYAMAGRAYDSRLLFSWPNSKISVMGMDQAVGVLTQIKIASLAREGKKPSAEELLQIEESVRDEYEQKSSAYWSTSEMWDDGIIDPADTRNALGMAISAALNAPIETDRIGLLRI